MTDKYKPLLRENKTDYLCPHDHRSTRNSQELRLPGSAQGHRLLRRGEGDRGDSGAGKSTLLQILGTLSTPDSGSLFIDGQDVLRLSGDALSAFRGRRIGFVFQAHHLLPEFTALENVMIPALIAGRRRQEAQKDAAALLERVGVSARAGHKPSELSGGEQQRVAIARAIINRPAVLFADEPTGNLDSVTRQEIHKLFFDLRDATGQTIVIVTHDPALAGLCDRSLTMKDGRFI